MKLFKKVLLLSSIAAVILGMTVVSSAAQTAPTISVDGTPITIESSLGTPYIDSANRTQVPVRALAESLGATVAWNDETKTATLGGTVEITIGSAEISTAYGTVTMDTKAVSKDGRIYVPARFVANALDMI